MAKNTLIVDTTVFGLWLGLSRSKNQGEIEVLTPIESCEGLGDSHKLIEILDRGLTDRELQLHQLDSILVSVGPGSFTGIKVGLAHVYGLMTSLLPSSEKNFHVYPFSALEEISEYKAQSSGRKTAVFLRASERKGAVSTCNPPEKPASFSWQVEESSVGEEITNLDQIILWRGWPTVENLLKEKTKNNFQILDLGSRFEIMKHVSSCLVSKFGALEGDVVKSYLPQPKYLREASLFGQ